MDETDEILYEKIDEILWLDWDPIGVNEFEVRDEYQSYTPAIYDLKKSGASIDIIAAALYKIETNQMGVMGDMEGCRTVAEKIWNL
jgi:hypothetical protein